jgi:hypothetical protein
MLGALVFLVAEGARSRGDGLRSYGRQVDLAAAVLTAGSLAAGALYAVIPDRLGEAILGDTWAQAHDLVFAFAVLTAASAVTACYSAGVRGNADGTRLVVLRVATFVPLVIAAAVGVAVWGAPGAAWAQAIVMTASVPFWRPSFRAGLSRRVALPVLSVP